MPMKAHVHRASVTMNWPRLVGYRPHPFLRPFHAYVDIEAAP